MRTFFDVLGEKRLTRFCGALRGSCMTDLDDRIETVAGEPRKASGDEGSMEQHSLSELVKAKKHLAANAALSGTSPRLMMNKIIPPGAV